MTKETNLPKIYQPLVGNYKISHEYWELRGARYHKGFDAIGEKGQSILGRPVVAVMDGTITRLGWEDGKNHSAGFGQRISMKYDNDDSGFEGTCH